MSPTHPIDPGPVAQARGFRGVTLPKPTITPAGLDHWTIDFGNGATGSIFRAEEQPMDRWDWTVEHADGRRESGYSYGDKLAFECAWGRAAQASAPASLDLAEFSIRRLAQVANERDVKAWAKMFRELIKQRTGRAWSVTIGKGTAYGWLRITSAKKSRDEYGAMSSHDTAMLAAVLGEKHVSRSGVSIGPERGAREAMLRQIVGPQAAEKVAV